MALAAVLLCAWGLGVATAEVAPSRKTTPSPALEVDDRSIFTAPGFECPVGQRFDARTGSCRKPLDLGRRDACPAGEEMDATLRRCLPSLMLWCPGVTTEDAGACGRAAVRCLLCPHVTRDGKTSADCRQPLATTNVSIPLPCGIQNQNSGRGRKVTV